MVNVVIAAFCSGSRSRFPISPPCSRRSSIPLLILPLLTFAITIVTQWIMLLLSSAVLLARGQSVTTLWNHLPLFQMSTMLLFHLVAIHGIQFAPIYCWMLLVSGWARRAPLLWAVLPPLTIGVAEKIAFNTSHFAALMGYLFGGGPEITTGKMAMAPLTPRAVGQFLINPGLWIGLVARRGIARRSGPLAPLSGTDLTRRLDSIDLRRRSCV